MLSNAQCGLIRLKWPFVVTISGMVANQKLVLLFHLSPLHLIGCRLDFVFRSASLESIYQKCSRFNEAFFPRFFSQCKYVYIRMYCLVFFILMSGFYWMNLFNMFRETTSDFKIMSQTFIITVVMSCINGYYEYTEATECF